MQYLALGIVSALLIVGFLTWCILGVLEPVKEREVERLRGDIGPTLGFFEQIKIAFSNKPFLMVCAIYLFGWLAVQLTGNVLLLWVTDWMELPGYYFPLVAIAVQGTALVMLPFWSWASRRIGKRMVYISGSLVWIGAQIGLVNLQPGSNVLMFILAILAGTGVSVAYLMPWSMIPDIIELDELNTGHRREGVFYGFMVLLQKLGLALGIQLVGKILDWQGYVESQEGVDPVQPDSALLALRLIVGPLPMLFLIGGIITAWFYPITKEKHREILDKLEERRRRKDEGRGAHDWEP
jgi:GPH family glycoside/pentoside/hexuronide:cation symporter